MKEGRSDPALYDDLARPNHASTAGMSARRHVIEQRRLHRIERGSDVDDLGMTLLDGGVRVFETVAGEGADDLAACGDLAVLDVARSASQRRGRRWFV